MGAVSALSPSASRPERPLDRLFDSILDRHGNIYGDERERTRWYEAIAVVASLQWILLPWALAVMVWFAGPATVPFLVAAFLVFFLPMPLAQLYIGRRGVRQLPDRTGRKYWATFVASTLPYPIFLIGVITALRASGGDTATWWGALVGGIVGGIIGLVLLLRSRQSRRRRSSLPEDLD